MTHEIQPFSNRVLQRRYFLRALAGSTIALPYLRRRSIAQTSPTPATKLDGRKVAESIERGARWLLRQQRDDGLFHYGFVPCVNQPLPEDNLLRQAGAAWAIVKASRFLNDSKLADASEHSLKALLAKTGVQAASPRQRFCKEPPGDVNPVGYAALLLIGLCERLESSRNNAFANATEELAEFLRRRHNEDGTIDYGSSLEPDGPSSAAGIDYFPGECLFAIARSNRVEKADWKSEFLDRARKPYRQYFAEWGSLAFVPWQMAAFAESFLQRRNRADAEFVFAMADRLINVQYGPTQQRSCRSNWVGGFGNWEGGAFVAIAPGIVAACYAEGLVYAVAAARAAGDDVRSRTYLVSLERALAFVMSLQFTAENIGHFTPAFRPRIEGGFHAGLEDGTVRIDFCQHAIVAMLGYLQLEGTVGNLKATAAFGRNS